MNRCHVTKSSAQQKIKASLPPAAKENLTIEILKKKSSVTKM